MNYGCGWWVVASTDLPQCTMVVCVIYWENFRHKLMEWEPAEKAEQQRRGRYVSFNLAHLLLGIIKFS